MAREILVVDDIPEMIEVVQAIFEERGYKVSGALSGEECLKKLKKKKPNLILLDLRMPGMDGWDVLKEIKRNKDTKGIPVIAYTTVGGLDQETLRERGVDEYIVKPFENVDLIQKVEGLIGKKR